MMIAAGSFVLLITLAAVPTLCYPSYQESLPNGNNVNHPCKLNYRWPGLGHNNPLGGGERNAFGLDYARLGKTWNTELCQLDSDGDGRTNGEELGDPQCLWRPGQAPQTYQDITHPGVCEPMGSPRCQGKVDFVDCEVERFEDCEAINYPEVLTTEMRFPPVQIPNTQTNHFCMTFDLPRDQDYHLVAYEPIIDNAEVMHHILMYGCKNPNEARLMAPELCFMTRDDSDCEEIIGLWAVGVPGLCFPPNLGFRIGATGYSHVRLEAHYNNPALRDDFTDTSGLRLYYQPAEPQFNDLYTLMTGQMQLEIPPGKARVPQEGVCKGGCTSKIVTKPAYIHSIFNHMHYLGRAMKIELFRNGRLQKVLTNDEYYSYDNPIEHTHIPSIQFLPGDEIRTTCVFNSLSTDRWTYFGEGTNDEMCFGFMTVYPKDAFTDGASCVARGPLDVCDQHMGTPASGCDWMRFLNRTHPDTKAWWNAVDYNCNYNGFCRPECREAVKQVMSHPCMKSDMRETINFILQTFHEGSKLLSKLYSCSAPDVGKDVCSLDDCRDVCQDDVRDSAATVALSLLSAAGAVITAFFVGSY